MARIPIKNSRRLFRLFYVFIVLCIGVWQLQQALPQTDSSGSLPDAGTSQAAEALEQLPVKGRAPKTGYSRELFYSSWGEINLCDTRNFVLARDMTTLTYVPGTCKIASGILNDPYTGASIQFIRGAETSDNVQIDHVVALSDSWQKGAQQLTSAERYALANDPLNLLAVDGPTNQNKGDSDAATWLPPNKSYRCAYVARQIAVKTKYRLWVTTAEYQAMARVLLTCPEQTLPRL